MKILVKTILLFVIPVFLLSLTLRGNLGNFNGYSEYIQEVHPGSAFETSHERAAYAQLIAIVEYGQYYLTDELAEFASPDTGVFQGKIFSYFPPGIVFAIMPLYILGKVYNIAQVLSFSTVSLFALANILLVYLLARKIFQLQTWASIAAALIFAFSTTAWNYSVTLFQHTFTTTFVLISFYAAWKSKESEHKWFWGALVMGSYGFSLFFDYTNIILLFPIVVYYFVNQFNITQGDDRIHFSLRGNVVFSSIIFLLAMSVFLWYGNYNFGNIFTTTNNLPRYTPEDRESLIEQGLFDNDPSNDAQPTQKGVSDVFRENRIIKGFSTLLFSMDKGLFWFSPILILAIFGFLSFKGHLTIDVKFFLLFICCNLLLYSSFTDPWGGWSYGPRYLIPSMPLLSLFVGKFINFWFKNIWIRILVVLLAIYSSGVALLGVLVRNNIPPSPEKMDTEFPGLTGIRFVLEYFKQGETPSFAYNHEFTKYFTLTEYYIFILGIIALVYVLVFIISPLFNREVKK